MASFVKVIDGRRYNTATATKVCGHWNGEDLDDFQHLSEYLYQTRTGKWFIHFRGGASSKYRRPVGNNAYNGDEDIKLITELEASRFIETHGTAKMYELFFSVEDA